MTGIHWTLVLITVNNTHIKGCTIIITVHNVDNDIVLNRVYIQTLQTKTKMSLYKGR